MNKQPNNLATALDAAKKGIVAIPCHPGTKTPCVKWKRWQSEMPSADLLAEWFANTRTNIAILTTGMVVFDCETLEAAEIVLRHCGATPHRVQTPGGGVHLGFRKRQGCQLTNKVKIKGLEIDLKTDGGKTMIPPSVTDKGAYQWLGEGLKPIPELPYANIGWTRERQRRRIQLIADIDTSDRTVRRARAYLSRIEGAVSGQGGHNRTMRVAGVLVQKFGLSIEQAWPLILEWNDRCEPPWSERELMHKLKDALRLRHRR